MDGWRLVYDDGVGTRKYERDAPEFGEWATLEKTEFYAADTFYGANQALLNESAGQRFGDFQMVASVPMTVWANELAQPIKEEDWRYIKRFLNDGENRAYRTFRGKV